MELFLGINRPHNDHVFDTLELEERGKMRIYGRKIYLPTTIAILLLASACSSSKPVQTEATTAGEPMSVIMEKNDSTITIKPGDQFTIQLDGNITTGYAWELEEINAELLRQVGEMEYREKSDDSDQEIVGAPGEFFFTFEALKSGKTSLRLIYHRSFEEGVEPLETFTLTVNIAD